MLEHHFVRAKDRLSGLISSDTLCRPDLPDGVVGALVEEADLLVAGETGEGEGRDWLRAEVERLVADELV